MNELISIVVPVYNAEKYLFRCIKSILNQTYKNLEIILVDDGSTDNSLIICKEFSNKDKRIKIVHQENKGASVARNNGVALSTGDYIGFVDSDDYIEKEMYEKLIMVLGKESGDQVISQIGIANEYYDGTREENDNMIPNQPSELYDDFIINLLLQKRSSSVCTKLFPANVFDKHRFKEGIYNEDALFIYSCRDQIKEVRYVDYLGYLYCKREDSRTKGSNKMFLDIINNAKIMREANEIDIQNAALRFQVHYQLAFIIYLIESKTDKRKEYFKEIQNSFAREREIIIRNKYLSKEEKMTAILFSAAPYTSSHVAKMVIDKRKRKWINKKQRGISDVFFAGNARINT